MIPPYYHDEKSHISIYNCDCREILPELPKVDLVLTDPPYGIKRDGMRPSTSRHGGRKAYAFGGWDSMPPAREVFELIFEKSDNQIIWGANYFPDVLPPSMGWIVWDKGQRIQSSDAELAFTSFQSALRVITYNRVELLLDKARHPTQKPRKLIKDCLWLAMKQAPIETVLDPFMGSGTTLVAAKQLGLSAVGIEISREYCDIAVERLKQDVFDFTEPLPEPVAIASLFD